MEITIGGYTYTAVSWQCIGSIIVQDGAIQGRRNVWEYVLDGGECCYSVEGWSGYTWYNPIG